MVGATLTLSEILRAETSEQHSKAEGKSVQQALLKGTITREQYAAWLGQMLHIHAELAAAAIAAGRIDARALMTGEAESHSTRLRADLASLGAPETKALAATANLIARIRTASPAGLIGMQYVRDGSMNGNKYIAMGVRKALSLAPGAGDTYLDPYGDRQRAVWSAFKVALDELALSESVWAEAVDGARAMFDGIAGMNEELGAAW